jgi:hypothetical protein
MPGKFLIQSREQFECNTDPQRRCYDGCHFSSEWQWTEWYTLYSLPTAEEAEESRASWQSLANSSGRRLEYRVKEER